MNITHFSKNSWLVFKPIYVFMFSISLGLASTLFWVQFSAHAATDTADQPSSSSDPYMFKDIEPGSGSSYPSYFTQFKGKMFFQASDSVYGSELWVSDGTVAGTVLFMDVLMGSQSSYPSDFTVMNDTLFFTALDENGDRRLWESDGTPPGTSQIPGAKTKCEYMMVCPSLVNLNNFIYFYGGDQDHGYELWKTDGTLAGTMMIKDIQPGPESSRIVELLNLNGTLYFFANDGIHGFELWKSDGTTNGTSLVKDINPGLDSSADVYGGSPIVVIDKMLYFKADDGSHGYELWKSDGTEAHTQLVRDIYPGQSGSYPAYLTNYDQELFFYADDGVHGRELWKSDGTTYGTTLVKDIRPGRQGKRSSCWPCQLGPIHQGYLYFEASSETTLQLWRTDGTTAGTIYVMDLAPETDASSAPVNGEISLNNFLYIHRYVSEQYGLWKSDGINPPSLIATDITPSWSQNPGPENFINDNYFFSAYSSGYGFELWTIPVTTHSRLSLSLTSQNVIRAGSIVTYTINFNNIGSTFATNVILTDTLSTLIHNIQYINSGSIISMTSTFPYVWQVSDLAPGDGGVITISAAINTLLHNGDVITNSAQISAQMSDGLFISNTRAKQGMFVDIPPTLSDINNLHTLINRPTNPIPLTVNDEDTPLNKLTLSGISSNTALIPNDHIAFSGVSSTRTMIITPEIGQTGSAIITVTVSDGSSSVFDTFTVYVDSAVYLPLVQNSYPDYIMSADDINGGN
jgi:uncharacterized repeat protein (TIGR01451 family)